MRNISLREAKLRKAIQTGLTLRLRESKVGELKDDLSKEESKSPSGYKYLVNAYKKREEFKDIDTMSGMIKDFTDDLDSQGIAYEYYDTLSGGRIIFYDPKN